MTDFTPREIVSELDRHIVGQGEGKRAVAIALRNRWRRKQLEPALREEVMPKNILMIGPTGVGKTEIARRLARLANALHQGRGDQVHRGRLCRARCRADDSRSAGGRHRQRADRAPQDVEAERISMPSGRCSMRWSDRRLRPPPAMRSSASSGRASSTTRRSRSRLPIPAAFRKADIRGCRAGRSA